MTGVSVTSIVTMPAEGVSFVATPSACPSVKATDVAEAVPAGSVSAYPVVVDALLVPIQTTYAPPVPPVFANVATITPGLAPATALT